MNEQNRNATENVNSETIPNQKFCAKCGTALGIHMEFCPKCGTKLNSNQQKINPEKMKLQQLVCKMQNASTADEYQSIIIELKKVQQYEEEAKEKIKICEKEMAFIEYDEAIKKIETCKSLKDWKHIVNTLKNAGDYKDAMEKLPYCEEKLKGVKAKTKKYTIIGSACAFILLLLCVLVFPYLPHYIKANKAYSSGKYGTAIDEYTLAGTFLDTEEKLVLAHYSFGIKLLEDKSYENAITELSLIKGYADSEAKLLEAYYYYGVKLLDEGLLEKAREAFLSAGDYTGTENMLNACDLMQAENYMANGYLNKAKKIYTKLPSDFEYKGIKVSNRLSKLKKYNSYVKMCGQWKASSCHIKVRQVHYSTGIWHEWYDDTSTSNAIRIRCIINSDGSVTLKGSVDFTRYSNYSSIGEYLKTKQEYITVSKNVRSIPNATSVGNHTTLTFTGNTFKINYSYTDRTEDIYFKYKYTSSATYKLIEAY